MGIFAKSLLLLRVINNQNMNDDNEETRDWRCVVWDYPCFDSYYGLKICDACRVLFRRLVLSKRVSCRLPLLFCVYNCYKTASWIRKVDGWVCTRCRFQKCLDVGMTSLLVLSNSICYDTFRWEKRSKFSEDTLLELQESHDFRRLLHLIPDLPELEVEATHDYLRVKVKDIKSEIRVVVICSIVQTSFRFTVEIPNGMVPELPTSFMFSPLPHFTNKVSSTLEIMHS